MVCMSQVHQLTQPACLQLTFKGHRPWSNQLFVLLHLPSLFLVVVDDVMYLAVYIQLILHSLEAVMQYYYNSTFIAASDLSVGPSP